MKGPRWFALLLLSVTAPLSAQSTSKAVFAEAQREPPGSARSIDLYERYVKLEPSDAWGFLALAEAHAHAREFDDAFAALARAEKLAPGEADVAIVRARIKRAHRNSLPSVKPMSHLSRDTDGNASLRIGAAGDVSLSNAARAGLAGTRTLIDDGTNQATADQANATFAVKTSQLRWNAEVGVARISQTVVRNVPAVQTQLRWAKSARAPVFDVRVRHAPLTAAYALVQAEAMLTEARGIVDLPIGAGIKLRTSGQLGGISDNVAADVINTPTGPGNPNRIPTTGRRGAGSTNRRMGIGAGLVRSLAATAELSVNGYRLSYNEPSTSGYFAPEHVDQLEVASYAEIYRFDPITIAIDAGVGVQRAKLFTQPPGGVTPAARFWGMLSAPLAEKVELNLEVDAYKSQLSTVATSASWSSMAAGLSLRLLID